MRQKRRPSDSDLSRSLMPESGFRFLHPLLVVLLLQVLLGYLLFYVLFTIIHISKILLSRYSLLLLLLSIIGDISVILIIITKCQLPVMLLTAAGVVVK